MRLKAAFWASLAFGIFLLLGAVVFVGVPPRHAERTVLRAFAYRTTIILPILLLSFLTTVVLAALVVRQTRQEVLDESAENLKMLIEGTLQDHRKKSGSDETSS